MDNNINAKVDIVQTITTAFSNIITSAVVRIATEDDPDYKIVKGDTYVELSADGKMLFKIKAEDLENESTACTEDSILNSMLPSSMATSGIEIIASHYAPLVVALCEYIYQVASMKDATKHVILCYRDSYLIHEVMKQVKRYKELALYPVWMNRDIAGSVAGFTGPGYQFEPIYRAYGHPNPYAVRETDDDTLENRKTEVKLNSIRACYMPDFKDIIRDGRAIIFDLSTCHFSAQETFMHLFPEIKFYGCYMLTFTRSTNDSYRMRDDYKAWGHISVTDQNSKVMKSLEKTLSWLDPAQDAGIVGPLTLSNEARSTVEYLIQNEIIKVAVKYLNEIESEPEKIPTIATALKALPDKFEM